MLYVELTGRPIEEPAREQLAEGPAREQFAAEGPATEGDIHLLLLKGPEFFCHAFFPWGGRRGLYSLPRVLARRTQPVWDKWMDPCICIPSP